MNRARRRSRSFIIAFIVNLCAALTLLFMPTAAYAASDGENSICASTLDEPSLLASIIFSTNAANTSTDSAKLSFSQIANYASPTSDGYCYGALQPSSSATPQGSALANKLKAYVDYGWYAPLPRTDEGSTSWVTHAIKEASSAQELTVKILLATTTWTGGIFDGVSGMIDGFNDAVSGLTIPGLLGFDGTLDDNNESFITNILKGVLDSMGIDQQAFKMIWMFMFTILLAVLLTTTIIALKGSNATAKGSTGMTKLREIATRVFTVAMIIPLSGVVVTAINSFTPSSGVINEVLKSFTGHYVVDTLGWAANSNMRMPGVTASTAYSADDIDENFKPTQDLVRDVSSTILISDDADRQVTDIVDDFRSGKTATVNDYFSALNKMGAQAGSTAPGAVGSYDVSGAIRYSASEDPFNFEADSTYFFGKPDANNQTASQAARDALVSAQTAEQERVKNEIIENKLKDPSTDMSNKTPEEMIAATIHGGSDKIFKNSGKATEAMYRDFLSALGDLSQYNEVDSADFRETPEGATLSNGEYSSDTDMKDSCRASVGIKACYLGVDSHGGDANADADDGYESLIAVKIELTGSSSGEKFYQITGDQVEATLDKLRRQYAEANLTPDELDKITAAAGGDQNAGAAQNGKQTLSVYGSTFNIDRIAMPSALVPFKISAATPTSYLYGAIPAGALDEYSKSSANYTYGPNNAIKTYSPEDGSKAESDQAKSDSLSKNAIAIAALNKYQGGSSGMTYQSTAFLLQSDLADDSLSYSGFNTTANAAGEAKNTGVNGNAFLRYTMPAENIGEMSISATSLAMIFVLSAILGGAVFLILLKAPIFGSLVKSFVEFLKAAFTGNVVSALRYFVWLIAMRAAFLFAGIALYIGGSLGLVLVGDSDTAVGSFVRGSAMSQAMWEADSGTGLFGLEGVLNDFMAGISSFTRMVVMIFVSSLVALALCLPIFKPGGKEGKRLSVMGVIIAAPFAIADAIVSKLDAVEARLYPNKGNIKASLANSKSLHRKGRSMREKAMSAAVIGANAALGNAAGAAAGAANAMQAEKAARDRHRNWGKNAADTGDPAQLTGDQAQLTDANATTSNAAGLDAAAAATSANAITLERGGQRGPYTNSRIDQSMNATQPPVQPQRSNSQPPVQPQRSNSQPPVQPQRSNSQPPAQPQRSNSQPPVQPQRSNSQPETHQARRAQRMKDLKYTTGHSIDGSLR